MESTKTHTAAGPSAWTARPLNEQSISDIINQIGRMNILSISGGRIEYVRDEDGTPIAVELPVSSGYKVRIFHDISDTYTVERVMVRGGKTFHKGTEKGIYCTEISEVAYEAGMYKSFDFGGISPR